MSGPILKGRSRRRHSRVRIEPFQALAAPISILRNRQAAVGSEAPPLPPRPLFRRFAAREESAGRRNARPRPEPGGERSGGRRRWRRLDRPSRRGRATPQTRSLATRRSRGHCVLGRDEAETQQKQRDSFRASEMNGFARRAQVLEIVGGAKWVISRNRLFSMTSTPFHFAPFSRRPLAPVTAPPPIAAPPRKEAWACRCLVVLSRVILYFQSQ